MNENKSEEKTLFEKLFEGINLVKQIIEFIKSIRKEKKNA
jgi:hypothetical protein